MADDTPTFPRLDAHPDYNRIQDPAGLIPEDEPVFIIRAKDRVSGDAVRAWADLAERAGAAPNIIAAARSQAALMDAWPHKQTPDMPTVTPAPVVPAGPASCNRHHDCDAADAKAIANGRLLGASHCHDDCCEDCFGS